MQGVLRHQDALEQAAALPKPHYATVCILRGGLPFPSSRSSPNILSLKEGGLVLVGTGGQNFCGNAVKAKANTPEVCCSPGYPEAHGKTASHNIVSILLFPYLSALRIPFLRILSCLSYCNYPAGQQQAPCPPLKSTAWCEQPLLEKEKEERCSQQHKDIEGMLSSVHI